MDYQLNIEAVYGSEYSLLGYLKAKLHKLNNWFDDALGRISDALRAFTLPWPDYVPLPATASPIEGKCDGFKEDFERRILCIYKWIADATILYPVIDKALKLKATGKTEKERYYTNIAHKLNHLGNLLASVVFQCNQFGQSWDTFITQENVNCLVDSFTCLNIDISRLLEIAGIKDGKCGNDICCPDIEPTAVLAACVDIYPTLVDASVIIDYTTEELTDTQSTIVTIDCCDGVDDLEFIKYETNYPVDLEFAYVDATNEATKTIGYSFTAENPNKDISFWVKSYYRFCGLYCLVRTVNYTMACTFDSTPLDLGTTDLALNDTTNDGLEDATPSNPIVIAATSTLLDLSCCYYTDEQAVFTGYTGDVDDLAAVGIIFGVPVITGNLADINVSATQILEDITDKTITANFTTCLGKKTLTKSFHVTVTLG